jgi:hypothetical protein
MHQLAWVRLMVARHPSIYWLAIALVSGVVALSAARAVAAVDTARRSWGDQRTVWMATAAIEPGQPITAAARDVPLAVAPVDATGANPSGTLARQRVGQGEIITNADVAAAGIAGLIPAGWTAFAVPASVDHFAIGDHLNVYSSDQLIAGGVVVDEGDTELMVAIPADAAHGMAAALLADAVTLALTPDP